MDSNKSAAGSRRSAVAERLRLRAEWAALKGADSSSDALRGTVALVAVAAGGKALALRAALSALGATVVSTWQPLVTHVVWGAGGCRKVRAKARALACSLVSPLWVEACAAAARRLPERAFPAASRPSDLPSPRALREMLVRITHRGLSLALPQKIAEKENLPLKLLQGTPPPSQGSQKPLQVTDSSSDSSEESDQSPDMGSKVNTAPRRALPDSTSPVPEKKSRRKLFTHKEEADDVSSDDGVPETRPKPPIRVQKPKPAAKITQQERRDLARAERMARRLAHTPAPPTQYGASRRPRIVLTGMSGPERKAMHEAIRKLNGRLQARVTKKTTHVILGSCCEPDITDVRQTVRKGQLASDVTGVEALDSQSIFQTRGTEMAGNARQLIRPSKPRTLNSLEGAARGCRVLTAEWVLASEQAGTWAHPYGYEVPHLRKLSQRARVERSALCQLRREYAYDVFCGLNVRVTDNANQRDAAKTLLLLCGAKVVDTESADVTVGAGGGHVGSKWVFDSVASARVRSTRRYVVESADVLRTVEIQGSDVFTLVGR